MGTKKNEAKSLRNLSTSDGRIVIIQFGLKLGRHGKLKTFIIVSCCPNKNLSIFFLKSYQRRFQVHTK